ncbi:MAG: TetR/AcrR family transcriptional regulator [Oscillospiraceae bacterium]|nr:TetR/AcrR family transcriptional regulator [Oscillospiraceae bacterium]
MKKKNSQSTKKKIVSAAWKLFYEQGYNGTTIDDIVSESGTSKGSFYHYFSSKDDLLSSLAYLFDEKYEELEEIMTEDMSCIEKMLFLNKELFRMIDDSISIDLLKQLLSSQLITKNEKSLLDHNRTYYKLLRSIVIAGQKNGEISDRNSANDIVKAYALYERAMLYDWCLCNGEYSLSDYSSKMLPLFLNGYLR